MGVWSGSSSVFCGATVISDEWILTASHCVDGTNPAEIQALLGEHDYWDSGESSMTRMDISEIIMHADYDSNTVDQDFALLKMARKLDWSANENIRPACLPSAGAGDYDQWMSTVTGWGTTSSGGSTSNVLLEVDVKVISNSECNGAYGGITNNMLCAADASGNGGSDACQGDRCQAMDRRQRPRLGLRILPQSLNHHHLATDSTLEIKTEAFRQRLARRKVS